MSARTLKPIAPQPGRPLYLTARDAVREAIDQGVFTPGEQMPSTKELSEQLSISLVTAHRALQELVTTGVLNRSQGRGTFVHERYHERRKTLSDTRIGLIFHAESSVADYQQSQILEGVRQAAQRLAIDLVMLRFGEDIRSECNGYLFINPTGDAADQLAGVAKPRQPIMAVGARVKDKRVSCVDVDNVDLARQAVGHLTNLGHTEIAYVGGDELNSSLDWNGFLTACKERGITPKDTHIIKSKSWRLDETERAALARILSGPTRPTAIFAAGYYFALDVYGAASTVGLTIPDDFSVVGVDDPPSAAHLSPPLTTLRQPLAQLGHAGVTTLFEQIHASKSEPLQRTLSAELVIRRSSGPAK